MTVFQVTGYWMFAFASNTFFYDFYIDFIYIIHMFESYRIKPCPILDTSLLRNVDSSLSSLEIDTCGGSVDNTNLIVRNTDGAVLYSKCISVIPFVGLLT